MATATDTTFPFPILIGDIGGTNARFALLVDAQSAAVRFPNVKTEDYPTIEAAIESSISAGSAPRPRSAILAIAGPIKGDEVKLTNVEEWPAFRPKDMLSTLKLDDILLINDFEAQALAAATLGDADREQIGAGAIRPSASRVVLGPGTGLGVAGLVYAQHSWITVPGEGGHVDVGPRSARDYAVWPHIKTIEGRVAAEQVLCGRGLVNLYRAICAADGTSAHLLDGVEDDDKHPALITTAGLAATDGAAIETLSLFATLLGRLAGDLALVFMARGGVFLAGGISSIILSALKKPGFRAAFEDKAPHSQLLKSIPTFVMTHPAAALEGLSAFARMPLNFGVATEGRRWRS